MHAVIRFSVVKEVWNNISQDGNYDHMHVRVEAYALMLNEDI